MTKEFVELLDDGDRLFTALENITVTCLKRFETMQPHEIDAFLEERQTLLAAIDSFTARLEMCHGESGTSGSGTELDDFRCRQASVLQRIIEADGLLIALAQLEASALKSSLAEISHGRVALHGYRSGEGGGRVSLKGTA